MIGRLFWSKKTRNFTSICLGLILFTAGMGKLYAEHAFPGLIGPVWLEERLAEYNLGLYARFVAYSQVLIGFLLLTLRYSTIGAIMAIPMFANILMITVSQQWTGTPYVNAFLLLSNLYILIVDYKKLLPAVHRSTEYFPSFTPSLRGDTVWAMSLVLIISSIILSTINLTVSYILVIIALIGSFFSFKVDKLKTND
jgi:hypothetical protein